MSEQDKIEITSNSSIHDYRTEIPNIVFELGLSGNEFRIYSEYKRIGGDNSSCWMCLKKLEERTGLSKKTIIEITKKLSKNRTELNNKSLITIKKRIKEDGGKDSSQIIVNDIWSVNMTFFLEKKRGGVKITPGVVEKLHQGGVKITHKQDPLKKIPLGTNKQEDVVCFLGSDEEIRKLLEPFEVSKTHIKIASNLDRKTVETSVNAALQYIENLKVKGKCFDAKRILTDALKNQWPVNVTAKDLEKQHSLRLERIAKEIQKNYEESNHICDKISNKFTRELRIFVRDDRIEFKINGSIQTIPLTDDKCIYYLKDFIAKNWK